jgi:hypothetical protein
MMVCIYCVKGRYSVSSIACRWARSVGAGGRAKQQSGGVVVDGIFDSELGGRVGGRSGPIIPLWAFALTVMSSFWALIPGTSAYLMCRTAGLGSPFCIRASASCGYVTERPSEWCASSETPQDTLAA